MISKEVSARIDECKAKLAEANKKYEAERKQIEEDFDRECQALLKKYGLWPK